MTYDSTSLDEERIRALARKTSGELTAAGIPVRGPRSAAPASRREERGLLGLRKRGAKDGTASRFWVVTTQVTDGFGRASGHLARWSTEGIGVLLTPGGELCAARGHADSRDAEDWAYGGLRPVTDVDLLLMDHHPGRFKTARPLEGERWRETWVPNETPAAHAKGVGVTVALWTLLGHARAAQREG